MFVWAYKSKIDRRILYLYAIVAGKSTFKYFFEVYYPHTILFHNRGREYQDAYFLYDKYRKVVKND